MGQAALASANNRLKQMTHGNCSEMAIMSLIKDFKELFGPQRTTPCYPLCHCYRLLSDTLASSGRRQEQIEAAEIAALEALGAKVRKKNSANNEQTEHADERMILEDPLIALQEAVIGCLKLVALHKQAGKEDLAR